ncbi:MAG: class I SAM-dependent methyltransferase [Candidatus Nealsonbacteria bacterium]
MWYLIFSKIYEKAGQRMCKECKDFIKSGSKILDLGCGPAIITKVFQNFFQAEIVGVDILDRRIFPIPFKIINGKSLPFSGNNFDAVLIAYVLHHSQDPIVLLKEAKRVTKDKIFIYEDLPEGIISSFFCKLHGFSFDKLFHNRDKTTFKREKEWGNIFKNLKLKVIFQKEVSSRLTPIRKKLFVLRKE